MLPNTILTLNKRPKIYKIPPKWRNFPKPGHTGERTPHTLSYERGNNTGRKFPQFWLRKSLIFFPPKSVSCLFGMAALPSL